MRQQEICGGGGSPQRGANYTASNTFDKVGNSLDYSASLTILGSARTPCDNLPLDVPQNHVPQNLLPHAVAPP